MPPLGAINPNHLIAAVHCPVGLAVGAILPVGADLRVCPIIVWFTVFDFEVGAAPAPLINFGRVPIPMSFRPRGEIQPSG